ncbi:MAG: ATP-dependent RNA helicase HrpA [Thiothrix sp.]|nr:MAG: ATP-dependent RNA helicase HrpA [Thiothrix sp.]
MTLEEQIKNCMRADFFRLSRKLHQLNKESDTKQRAALQKSIEKSVQQRTLRKQSIPDLNYPEELPVSSRNEIAQAIKKNQVVLLCGETGSGKTTQLPKICLELGRGIDGTIGHTQPRRLAARAVANRIAEETKTELGTVVGFHTRFQKKLGAHNLIKVMTDGILLTEIQQDRWLNRYDTLIIDEAHERSLNIDFLLGYLKQLLTRRADLKLIITSATIDAQRIAEHFDNAPVLEVSGRTWPIELLYRPLTGDDQQETLDINQAIEAAVEELQAEGRGDVLVFLPGEREIHEASHALRHLREHMDILPLYARLPPKDQQRIFHAGGRTRVILSTNVAETSLTVPGIRYVIDTGLARISRYSWRTKIQRLPTEKISQASANQRSGRCGRTGPGVCIRLYDEEDFNLRTEFTDPEILRTNLASVILQMAGLKLGSIDQFPFIDSPDPRLVRDGYRLLSELQATDNQHNLTAIGRQLVRLPIDPRLGRMLLAAQKTNAVAEVLIITTALAVQDPRDRPREKQQAADEKHAKFTDKQSDFIVLLNLWNYLEERNEALTKSAMRRLCSKEFISARRWFEWHDTHRQVKLALQKINISLNSKAADYAAIHRALMSGLLDYIGLKEDKQCYEGSRNRKFYIFPGSELRKKPPKWIMAAEITETSRLYARNVAHIQPEWIEQLGAHLLKHHLSEPHWQRRAARVSGYEKLTLYGLVINPQRRVNYAQKEPVVAREIFIRHALVYGEYTSKQAVIVENRKQIENIEALEARTRRRDILIDEQALFDFYDHLLPEDIHSGAAFESWYKKLKDPQILQLDNEQLTRDQLPDVSSDAYPKTWEQQGLRLPLEYHFDPGTDEDGITLKIPLAVLPQIDSQHCDWLVPAVLEEKILALIKGLPKALRKNFVPAPDFTRAIREKITLYDGVLFKTLSTLLHSMTGVQVPTNAWGTRLPDHLKMRFEVFDKNNKTLATGRDLEQLRQQLKGQVKKQKPAPLLQSFEREALTQWDFGEIPEYLECDESGYSIRRYPALTVEKDQLVLHLFDTEQEARLHMPVGLRQLLKMQLKQEIRALDKNLSDMARHCLLFSTLAPCQTLKNDLLDAALQNTFLNKQPWPRNREDFQQLIDSNRSALLANAETLYQHLGEILPLFREIQKQLKGSLPLNRIEAAADIKTQLERLIFPGFLLATSLNALKEIPRYLKAIQLRLDKLDQSPDKDRMRRMQVEPLAKRILDLDLQTLTASTKLQTYRWLLEELRVSVFAQELGAKGKVSVKRLDKLWKSFQT